MNPNAPGSALPSAVFIDTIDASRLRDALRELRRSETFAGMLALVAEQDRACVAMLQRECGELGVSLVGGLFPALIHRTSLAVHGVWLIPLHHEMRYELIEQVEPDVDAAAATCAEAIDRMQLKERASLHLLVDATLQRIASLLESLFRELGDSVRYSGACAGCETFVRAPCVFDSTRFVENAVLALVLPDSVSAFAHGYTAPDDEGTATASSGNRVRSINWAPAFDVYREKLHRLLGVELDSENFYAHAVHFPFGIVMGDHHLLVRIPIALPNDGSISTAGEIPEQSLLSLLRGPELGSRRTIDEVIEQLGGKHASRQLLTWYCAGRRLHMGDATGDELTQLEEHSGAQILGALSLGEIGAFGASSPYFHNGLILCTSLDGA